MIDDRWLARRIIAFAHQGGSFEGPSSTLHAIRSALDAGATAIELDVHATKDRTIVVSHDETVDATTGHSGVIAELDLSQLAEMDNAFWWQPGATVTPGGSPEDYPFRGCAPNDRNFSIVTLEEVVRAFPSVLLNLDIKRCDPEVEPYEELLANELQRLERRDSVIVASFHDSAIQRFRAIAPGVATSAATGETAAFYFSHLEEAPVVAPVRAFQVPATFDGIEVVTERFVDVAHQHGVAVHVWTVNRRDEMDRLIDLGVDGIITDTPTPLATLLKERDCGWDGVL